MKNRLKIDFTFLNKAVKTSGIKKQEIATKIGVSREAFHRWTTGKVAYLEENKIEKLARILECDPTLIAPELSEKETAIGFLDPSQIIPGDTYLKMGLMSGHWREIHDLYTSSKSPMIVQDHKINVGLFNGLRALLTLNPNCLDKSVLLDESHSKYELFDFMAKRVFISSVHLMLNGQLEVAERQFRQTIIQGRTEWLVAMSYWGAAVCQLLSGNHEKADGLIEKGCGIFSQSIGDLVQFAVANLFLLRSMIGGKNQSKRMLDDVFQAKAKFALMGYPFGDTVCQAFLHHLVGQHQLKSVDLVSSDILLASVKKLPPLFQVVVLVLTSHAGQEFGETEERVGYLDTAAQVAHQSVFIKAMINLRRLSIRWDKELCESILRSANEHSLPKFIVNQLKIMDERHEKSVAS